MNKSKATQPVPPAKGAPVKPATSWKDRLS